jgi:hypothetical protein
MVARKVTSNTKLIEFQFKIIHRAYASNSYVSNFDDTVNQMCILCNTKCNTQHTFSECIKVTAFWNNFTDWINEIPSIFFEPTTKNILFGNLETNSFSENFCLLHAKWYIHSKREEEVRFDRFLGYLKNVIKLEKEQSIVTASLPSFHLRFNRLITMLGDEFQRQIR